MNRVPMNSNILPTRVNCLFQARLAVPNKLSELRLLLMFRMAPMNWYLEHEMFFSTPK